MCGLIVGVFIGAAAVTTVWNMSVSPQQSVESSLASLIHSQASILQTAADELKRQAADKNNQ